MPETMGNDARPCATTVATRVSRLGAGLHGRWVTRHGSGRRSETGRCCPMDTNLAQYGLRFVPYTACNNDY